MTSTSSSVRLVLIGPPGAGKSTVGHLLARQLGVTFRDTDTDIETATGRAIPDIFIEDGEEHFRDLEEQAVQRALAQHDGVLALGGGAILRERTQRALAGVPVAFLDVSMAAAMPRVGLTGARPLLVGSPRRQWHSLMTARRPIYERLASIHLLTDGHTPEELAVMLQTALEGESGRADAARSSGAADAGGITGATPEGQQ